MSRKLERRTRRALWSVVNRLGKQGMWPAENVKLWVTRNWPSFIGGQWKKSVDTKS